MDTSNYNERLKTTGRNDPCPCGSAKKYKKCHLTEDEEAKRLELVKAAKERAAATEEVDAKSPDKPKDSSVKPDFHAHRGKTTPGQNRHSNLPRRGAI